VKKTPALLVGVFLLFTSLVHVESAKAACGNLTALFDPATYTSGTTLVDQGGCNNAGTIIAGTPVTTAFPARYRLNQSGSGQSLWLNAQQTNPTVYSIGVWFKTSIAGGTKLMGFVQYTATSEGGYDRHIYIGRDGKIYYGAYNNSPTTTSSSATFNDGKWHLAVATQNGSSGKLYVDSTLVGSFTATPANYSGYWKVGGYSLSGWNDGIGGLSNGDWVGDVGKVYIYGSTQLSDAGVLNLYNSSKGYYSDLTASIASPSGALATYRTATSLQLSSNIDGKATFYQRNKRIAGCINIATSSGSATCSWKPTVKANTTVYARVVPADSSIPPVTTTQIDFQVKTKATRR
jgi:hypothetical protein